MSQVRIYHTTVATSGYGLQHVACTNGGRLLQLLVAQRLGVTHSAVSHLLNKRRVITGDPLFVKSGRSIVATARAEGMERLCLSGEFEPENWLATFTIAATDFQRDVLLPPLTGRLRGELEAVVGPAPGATKMNFRFTMRQYMGVQRERQTTSHDTHR